MRNKSKGKNVWNVRNTLFYKGIVMAIAIRVPQEYDYMCICIYRYVHLSLMNEVSNRQI